MSGDMAVGMAVAMAMVMVVDTMVVVDTTAVDTTAVGMAADMAVADEVAMVTMVVGETFFCVHSFVPNKIISFLGGSIESFSLSLSLLDRHRTRVPKQWWEMQD